MRFGVLLERFFGVDSAASRDVGLDGRTLDADCGFRGVSVDELRDGSGPDEDAFFPLWR